MSTWRAVNIPSSDSATSSRPEMDRPETEQGAENQDAATRQRVQEVANELRQTLNGNMPNVTDVMKAFNARTGENLSYPAVAEYLYGATIRSFDPEVAFKDGQYKTSQGHRACMDVMILTEFATAQPQPLEIAERVMQSEDYVKVLGVHRLLPVTLYARHHQLQRQKWTIADLNEVTVMEEDYAEYKALGTIELMDNQIRDGNDSLIPEDARVLGLLP